ncbi:hypothetical protein BZG35_11975 [Brevundimonas sp. LM2]|uniref:N-acetylmuramoyl-L-alanine amidase n=1 Tax=Brevundimonas sp. LM2 TaxID=1938605 RepID=UPI000984095A|nr:N-acetylmuramoyl-L-alanine amidase [Brevundimonas sp. LM2]AQR62282.1 hypothetical protein BZG35_11975 [Brevundimonas sp. LM2]
MLTVRDGVLLSGMAAVQQIKSPNHGGAFAPPPGIVVIHYTVGSTALLTAKWFCNPANTSSSAHVVIDRDGSIIQCVNFGVVAWHAGKSSWDGLTGLNRYSIGIELANWGPLKGSGSQWLNGAGKAVADPFIGVHRNGNPNGSRTRIGWEAYPDAQVDAAVALTLALKDVYPIKTVVGHDDIAPIRKSDPGPAFDMARFRSRVFDERKDDGGNIAVVDAPAGLNLRSGPGQDYAVLELLKDKTVLEPLGQSGNWLEVTVLDADHRPIRTGWVHTRYIRT